MVQKILMGGMFTKSYIYSFNQIFNFLKFLYRFICYSEGITKATLRFTNQVTGEYCFYSLTARTTTSDVLEVIKIESPVRQTARYVITADNPLPRDNIITMGSATKPEEWWTCDTNVIRLTEINPFSGNNEASFEIEYRPLTITKQNKDHLLVIMTKDLGHFKYKLNLSATAPTLRPVLRFEVPLGSTQTENFVFRSFNSTSNTFSCSIKHPEFLSITKSLQVDSAKDWDGAEVRFPVSFEPMEIGEVSDTLCVASNEAGEYICDIVASCTPPLPQGPFNFTSGSSLDIPFRNCFDANYKWQFSVDSPYYKLSIPSTTVNAKTKSNCTVVFEPTGDALTTPGGFVSAKLFIKCESKPNIPPWVFYLKGRVDPTTQLSNTGAENVSSKPKAKK